MKYFAQFPEIVYNNYTIKNILAKVKLNDLVRVTSEAYYPYTLEENEKPWMIATDYYGDPNLVWLVYMSNDMIDPYYDWHMNTEELERYLIKKYGSLAAAQAQLLHYKEIISGTETGRIFSTDTYTYLSGSPGSDKFASIANLYPVYAYDYESEQNELKRTIRLLNVIYADQAAQNLKEILSI